jgi:hypothetical protein
MDNFRIQVFKVNFSVDTSFDSLRVLNEYNWSHFISSLLLAKDCKTIFKEMRLFFIYESVTICADSWVDGGFLQKMVKFDDGGSYTFTFIPQQFYS